jgi:hypothetical protein
VFVKCEGFYTVQGACTSSVPKVSAEFVWYTEKSLLSGCGRKLANPVGGTEDDCIGGHSKGD